MMPLEAALSSLRDAAAASSLALVASPDSAASRKLRIAVLRADFTDLLRSCATRFCLLRLIWDLMFATEQASVSLVFGDLVHVWVGAGNVRHTQPDTLPVRLSCPKSPPTGAQPGRNRDVSGRIPAAPPPREPPGPRTR